MSSVLRLQSSNPINDTNKESKAETAVWDRQRRFGKLIMGAIHILNSAAQPTNTFSFQILHHLKGIKWCKICFQEAFLQQTNTRPHKSFLAVCAKFICVCVCVSLD